MLMAPGGSVIQGRQGLGKTPSGARVGLGGEEPHSFASILGIECYRFFAFFFKLQVSNSTSPGSLRRLATNSGTKSALEARRRKPISGLPIRSWRWAISGEQSCHLKRI